PTLTRSRGGDGDGCSTLAPTRTAYRPSACLAAIGQTIGSWYRLRSGNLHGLDNMASASSGLQLIPKSIARATKRAPTKRAPTPTHARARGTQQLRSNPDSIK